MQFVHGELDKLKPAYQVFQKASVLLLTGNKHQAVDLALLDLFVVLLERFQITIRDQCSEFRQHASQRYSMNPFGVVGIVKYDLL